MRERNNKSYVTASSLPYFFESTQIIKISFCEYAIAIIIFFLRFCAQSRISRSLKSTVSKKKFFFNATNSRFARLKYSVTRSIVDV